MHLGSRFYKVSPSYKSTSHLPAMAKRTASFSQIKPITLKSNKIKQQGTVIFLHGLGDTGYGWLKIMEILHKQTPHIKYILPSAPSRPVTINGGMSMPAWYDIKTLSEKARSEPLEGLPDTSILSKIDKICPQALVSDLIEEEIGNGIPSNKIMLGGFSQGGASAMYVGYTYPKRLAGLLFLSAYMPQKDEFMEKITEENKMTPFFMCHGECDNVIQPDFGKRSYEQLITLGRKGAYKTYPDMGHEAIDEEIYDCLQFINSVFGSNAKL